MTFGGGDACDAVFVVVAASSPIHRNFGDTPGYDRKRSPNWMTSGHSFFTKGGNNLRVSGVYLKAGPD